MKKPWFQFSLRTVIILTLLAGLLVGAGVWYYKKRLQDEKFITLRIINGSGKPVNFGYRYVNDQKEAMRRILSPGDIEPILIERDKFQAAELLFDIEGAPESHRATVGYFDAEPDGSHGLRIDENGLLRVHVFKP